MAQKGTQVQSQNPLQVICSNLEAFEGPLGLQHGLEGWLQPWGWFPCVLPPLLSGPQDPPPQSIGQGTACSLESRETISTFTVSTMTGSWWGGGGGRGTHKGFREKCETLKQVKGPFTP